MKSKLYFHKCVVVVLLYLLAGCSGAPSPTMISTGLVTISPTHTSLAPATETAALPDPYPPPRRITPRPTSTPAPTATLTPTLTATPSPPSVLNTTLSGVSGKMAFVGIDHNIWLADPQTGAVLPVTTDGYQNNNSGSPDYLYYSQPVWSSDGTLLAFHKSKSVADNSYPGVVESLWVYDLQQGGTRQILEDTFTSGYSWQPGTHILAYAINTYYIDLEECPDGTCAAQGIQAIDVDTGRQFELVAPQDVSLVRPRWSRDGRYLVFQNEGYEASGWEFCYYDFTGKNFVSWGRTIGGQYDWSPHSRWVIYDNIPYTGNVLNQLFYENLQGADLHIIEDLNLGDSGETYQFISPSFADSGDQIAYVAERQYNEVYKTWRSLVVVRPFPRGEPRILASYDGQVPRLSWLSNDRGLVYVVHQDHMPPEIHVVTLPDGNVSSLIFGTEPAWQP